MFRKQRCIPHSSVLAWRIPGNGEPGGLLSMGSPRVGHAHLAAMATGMWTWARYSRMTLKALGFQSFTCRAPCPSHCLPEPKPESPSNPQNTVFPGLRQQYLFAGQPPCIQQLWLLLEYPHHPDSTYEELPVSPTCSSRELCRF